MNKAFLDATITPILLSNNKIVISLNYKNQIL